jgi:hypothetical protein
MRQKNNYIIDQASNRLTFLDARFYQTLDGSFVPSVTTILDAYPKGASFYNWLKENGTEADSIRDEAGISGSIVHSLTEQYDMGEQVSLVSDGMDINYKMSEWAMFERYVEFSQRFNPKHHLIEYNHVSPELGYAGTIDRLCTIDDISVLMDIKTSGSIYPSYWLQLAAYYSLLKNDFGSKVPLTHVGVLWLNAKTRTEGKKGTIQGPGWQLITKPVADISKDLELFEITHKLWLAENDSMKPRNTSYQLKHKK